MNPLLPALLRIVFTGYVTAANFSYISSYGLRSAVDRSIKSGKVSNICRGETKTEQILRASEASIRF